MKVVFITNYINHHQAPVADEFYRLLGENYCFVATIEMYEWRKKLGYPDFSDRPYLVNAYQSEGLRQKALDLAYHADVVIIGSAPEYFVSNRIKAGKLTFRYNERWFKTRPWYMSGPRAWLNFYRNHIRYKYKPVYMLAASAFTANDVYAIGAYKNKVYKWGYFTRVDTMYSLSQPCAALQKKTNNTIMWCGRFLGLKHPELPIMLAQKLKVEGYVFSIDMYGDGEELGRYKALAKQLDVEDVVIFKGTLPNQAILDEMRKHEIFLFTSDQNEGWGAVLNESMSNGCAVVASNRIGATPFLVKDGENGLVFESENLRSLYAKVKILLDDEDLRKRISSNAYQTMSRMWNPKSAAERFIQLANALQQGNDTPFVDGPCSKAYPCKY